MESNVTQEIIDLYKENNWRDIVDRYHDHPDRNKVLWVYPSEENFGFIRECLDELHCEEVVSIGCGSGLLEWLLIQATGYRVSGVEVDGAWWHCRYAPPTFIPLLFTSNTTVHGDVIKALQNPGAALMFCYFNNRPAFEEYLTHFVGDVLIIIGPGDGKGVHTDPRPFDDVNNAWKLFKSQEVRDSKDFIAIYKRDSDFIIINKSIN